MAMNSYDIGGASAGQASQLQPEERQMQRIQRMVQAAESSNYDGDPDYYNQIKALAMQAGIPIKGFKTNPFRLAKVGLMSMADTAMFGLLPNSMYTPEGGHVNAAEAGMDTAGMIAGAALGGPAWALGKGLTMGGKMLAGGALKGGNISKMIQASPGLMKRMGIQPKGTAAAGRTAAPTAQAAKEQALMLTAGKPGATTTAKAAKTSTPIKQLSAGSPIKRLSAGKTGTEKAATATAKAKAITKKLSAKTRLTPKDLIKVSKSTRDKVIDKIAIVAKGTVNKAKLAKLNNKDLIKIYNKLVNPKG